MTCRVALIGDFDRAFPPHTATEQAVSHAAAMLSVDATPQWVGTKELEASAAERLAGFAAVWIAPGSPYQSLSGALAAIRYARENDIPLLGTCGGFQHVVIEYARNVLGRADAAHAEYDPYASDLFISRLACSPHGKTMQVRLTAGSRAAKAYGSLAAQEQYHCNFGINPAVVGQLFASKSLPARLTPRTLTIAGADQDGEPRVVELAGHPFYVATLFVPQMRSQPGQPHPLVTAWLVAAAR